MASRVKELTGHLIGRKLTNAGEAIYHAADGVSDGGEVGKEKRHSMRKALHKLRLRASGMSDDINGSKETMGGYNNPFEAKP